MKCEEAQTLFQAYLDDELSSSLSTELAAHRVKCSECRRGLALMEVAGHVVANDAGSSELAPEFSDRLLACMESPVSRWRRQLRRTVYLGVPALAAAAVALAFLGVFDRGAGEVAGKTVTSKDVANQPVSPSPKELVEHAQKNIASKRKSVETLQNQLDLTIGQILDILDEAKPASPEAKSGAPNAKPAPPGGIEIPSIDDESPADAQPDGSGETSEIPPS